MKNMRKDSAQYQLASQLILELKQLIIVLNEISKNNIADEGLIKAIAGGDGYILDYNKRFISPYLGVSSDALSQLVFSKSYAKYFDIKLQRNFNQNDFLNLAVYCQRGLSRGLSEWWAPTEISQIKKDHALDEVYKSAQAYLTFVSA